jgi:hypothetical protein
MGPFSFAHSSHDELALSIEIPSEDFLVSSILVPIFPPFEKHHFLYTDTIQYQYTLFPTSCFSNRLFALYPINASKGDDCKQIES